ncbi:membrane protein, hypothetical [Theileria equi strain WA]|uniref:Membrane protein, hypothetical n=1 Tax=Theileria equi strain WA TaxID=1537102 RepID=L0AYG0_THEEQ|nr:membrane protein, hypothetical [Theileria equi strain WA]AFZ80051.1 membrane protein, hypothetical [Theileria equi strain WA]|eukprot:XP_004829717.1 membrane protein, hypothetical [Theileria equi strain WA]
MRIFISGLLTLISILKLAYCTSYNQLIGLYSGNEAEHVIFESLANNRPQRPKILQIDDDLYFKLVLAEDRSYTSAVLFINTENEAHLELLRLFSGVSRRLTKGIDGIKDGGGRTYFFYCNVAPGTDSWFLETQGIENLPEILVVGPEGQAYSFNNYIEDLTERHEIEWSVEVLEELIEVFLGDCMSGEWDGDGTIPSNDRKNRPTGGKWREAFHRLFARIGVDTADVFIYLVILMFALATAILRSGYGRYVLLVGSYFVYFLSISCVVFSLVNRTPLYDHKGTFYVGSGNGMSGSFTLIKWPNVEKLFSKDRAYQYGLEGVIFSLLLLLAVAILLGSANSEDGDRWITLVIIPLLIIYRLFAMKTKDHVLYVLPPRDLPRGWLIEDRQGIF